MKKTIPLLAILMAELCLATPLVAATARTATENFVTNKIAAAISQIPPPDFSTNNVALVETIEAKAPAPGDYAAVSNAAMNALSRNGGTVTLSNGIFAVGWDDDFHGTGFVPCIAVDMTGVDPIITIGDDYAGHGGVGETYFRNPVRFRDYASVDFEYGFTTYGDRGNHEVYVNGQPQYVDYALVTDITPAISNTVPAWALAAQKPTYTASEVGAYSTGDVDTILQDYLPLDYFHDSQTIPMYYGDGTFLCDFGVNWLGNLVDTVDDKTDAAEVGDIASASISNIVTAAYINDRVNVTPLAGRTYDFATNIGLYTAVRDIIQALGGSVTNFPAIPQN